MVDKKKYRTRGKPTLDSYEDPEQLTDRMREFGDLMVMGIPPTVAGMMLGVKEQQVNRWLANKAMQKYIREKSEEKGTRSCSEAEITFAIWRDTYRLAMAKLRKLISEDSTNVSVAKLHQISKEGLVSETVVSGEGPGPKSLPDLRGAGKTFIEYMNETEKDGEE